MKRKKILLLGGSGFLGSRLVKQFKSDIVIAPSHTEIDLLKSDIYKKIEDEEPDVIIYATGVTRIHAAELQKELAFKLNVQIPEQIAKFISSQKIPMIYISSDAVFDGYTNKYMFCETDQKNAKSIYGKSKLQGEEAIQNVNSANTIVRLITLFGIDYQRPNFLTRSFKDLKNKKRVFGITDQIQNPVLVDVAAEAISFIAKKQLNGIHHVGTLDWDTNYNFMIKFANTFRLDTSLIEKISFKNFMKDKNSFRKKNSVLLCNKFNTVSENKILKSLDNSFNFLYSSANTN